MTTQLTADVHTGVECFRDLWVHLDEKLLLLCQFFVSAHNLVLYPSLEGRT